MLSKNDELFLTVAKSESISKAAEQLYISQPSLTKRMQQLEAQLRDEEERTKKLEEYKVYVKTKQFAEEVAKEKLGLVNPDEILLKPNK